MKNITLMKRIMVVDADNHCVGEGVAFNEDDLVKAMRTLVPILNKFNGARLIVEDIKAEQFRENIEIKDCYVPCVAHIKAKSYADAVAEVERMFQGQSLISVNYRQLCDDDDYDFNDCFD